jgi:hypothetical protein
MKVKVESPTTQPDQIAIQMRKHASIVPMDDGV